MPKNQTAKIVSQIILGLAGLIAIASALFLWRISAGPIPLNKLTPSIQQVVASLPGAYRLQMGGVELVWDRDIMILQLRATQVALLDQGGATIVAAPTVNISISLAALMKRVIALSAVELEGISIHLIRNKDGSLQLGAKTSNDAKKPHETADSSAEFHDLTEVLAHSLKLLESPPDPRYPLSYLQTIKVKGEFKVKDHKLDMEVLFRDISFSFSGQDNGITGDLALLVDGPEALSGVQLEISLLAHGSDVTADIGINGVHLSRLAGLDERLKLLAGIDLTVNGSVTAAMILPDTIKSLELSIDDQDATGPSLKLSGKPRSADGRTELDITAEVEHFAIEDLGNYWPTELAPGTRSWLTENLTEGMVDKVSADITLTLPPQEGGALLIEKLQGKLAFTDLSVFFFRPLPPAEEVTGTGTFNLQGLALSVDKGRVGQVTLQSGRVQINGLDADEITLSVKTTLDGSVADTLTVLASPPIGLDKIIGFGSADAGGQLSAEFNIALPLKTGLQVADIVYQVDARVQQASVKNIIGDFSLDKGTVEIFYNRERLALKGTLDLAGIPVAIDLKGHQDDNSALQTNITASAAAIGPDDIDRLGYSVDEFLAGSFAADLEATINHGGVIDFALTTDLGTTALSIPALSWHKPSGIKGNTKVTGKMSKKGQISVDSFRVDAGSLSAHGQAAYDPKSSKVSIAMATAALDQTVLNDVSITRDATSGTRINVANGRLDLKALLNPDSHPVDNKDRFIEDASVELTYHDSSWQSVHLSGRNTYTPDQHRSTDSGNRKTPLAPGEFKFHFGPSTQDRYPLSIEVENLGALLVTALDSKMLAGGYMSVQGGSSKGLLTAAVKVSLKLTRFTVLDMPLVAQLLNVASLDHPMRTLKKEGLFFDSLAGELEYFKQKLSTELLRLHGGTLGATIVGVIDLEQSTLKFKGGLIPLYRISNVLAKIPLLKQALVGDDGEGVVTLNYTIDGDISKPETSVVPGVVLTADRLRHHIGSSVSELGKH